MKNFFLPLLVILLIVNVSFSSPKISFNDLLRHSEEFPDMVISARKTAMSQNLPVNILTRSKVMYDVKGIEDGKAVYAVITDFADVYNGSYCAFYEDIVNSIDVSNSRLDYGNGKIIDNTGGLFNPILADNPDSEKYLMIPDWTYDRVYLFKASNGDLVDTAFIRSSNPQLQSPKHALQRYNKLHILVADQISDLVQKFDTAGFYITYFAPSTGVNNAILDNIRGIRFRANRNLLVTVASGGSQNTIQQFDTAGNHLGTFIGSNVNSPFDILLRNNNMLISNSSGTDKITKFDLNGNFISSFYSGSALSFPQQMMQVANGNILVAGFSSPSGLIMFDSTGNYLRSLTAVTGLRSIYLLGNGHYLTTNSTGVHELDSSSGTLIRTVVTGANYQYISEYDPNLIVSVNSVYYNAESFNLHQNYPNPFNPVTNIKFDLPFPGVISLNVYDVIGNKIKTLVSGFKNSGSYEVSFDASELPSGIYFCKLISNSGSVSMKMLLIK